jgi:hypothetical protein
MQELNYTPRGATERLLRYAEYDAILEAVAQSADAGVGSGNSEPLIPEILSRSALTGEASSKFR